ncbi:spore coat protein SP85-like isoform X2 [Belonocnema kinseyi]|nr:spore coat protein SP85-like isoform X2 [Belonocnema kinseyi]XP_033211226.1 spore coat protein SP85-like isoform X2 [Belonocnema kinseyi]
MKFAVTLFITIAVFLTSIESGNPEDSPERKRPRQHETHPSLSPAPNPLPVSAPTPPPMDPNLNLPLRRTDTLNCPLRQLQAMDPTVPLSHPETLEYPPRQQGRTTDPNPHRTNFLLCPPRQPENMDQQRRHNN